MFADPGAVQTVGLFAGQHVLAELEGVDAALLDDEPFLRRTLTEVLDLAGATVCDVISKQFEPQGVTVLALLSESHASVHTYPERGALFVDVFTCGDRAKPELAVELLTKALRPTRVQSKTIHRGADTPVAATGHREGAS
ncbi:adenosylmethionine decarboxylase [Streptoalloteichus hindustanus]|uniref:S-adenosylmethionine decarboxylase proenzyme n=1 Tax=Streptoalloteichus hindustanus TaxID=2017 RepID=A0A1M5PD65_STRHI|nr:adenosylmethionine decarboxylase [Streptoalloteichus hindustanus]SHG99657.1 S-adenosylmethionine decarboxylase [Streptoalloteichus hindustanus]